MSIIVEQLLIIFCTFVSSNRYLAEYHTILWERCTIPIICEKSRLGTVEVLNDLLMSESGAVVETPPPF